MVIEFPDLPEPELLCSLQAGIDEIEARIHESSIFRSVSGNSLPFDHKDVRDGQEVFPETTSSSNTVNKLEQWLITNRFKFGGSWTLPMNICWIHRK